MQLFNSQLFKFLAVCLLPFMKMQPVLAAEWNFDPAPLFAEVASEQLQIAPVSMGLAQNTVYISGTRRGDRGMLMTLDATTLEQESRVALDITPASMVISNTGHAFVIGDDAAGDTQLRVLNKSLKVIAEYKSDSRLIYPILSLPNQNILVIGSLNADMNVLDVSSPDRPVESDYSQVSSQAFGVGNAWGALDGNTVFINLHREVALVAFDVGNARRLDDISYHIKGGGTEPFTVAALTGDAPCQDRDEASFLIFDTRRGGLTLASYDSRFRSLNIQTEISVGMVAEQSNQRSYISDNIIQPTGLVATSCDQSIVWVGTRHSSHINQYAVNRKYRSIEKSGVIELAAPPTALLIDPEGQFALLASAVTGRISRFMVSKAGYAPTEPENTEVRTLQRLLTEQGYPVGPIDGIYGPATDQALILYEANRGIEVNTKNLEATLEQFSK